MDIMDIIEQAIADVEKEFCARWRAFHSIDFININIPSVARSQRAQTSRDTKRQDKRQYRTWVMDLIPTPPPQPLLTPTERTQIIDFWVNHFMYYYGEIGDKIHQIRRLDSPRWSERYDCEINLTALLDPDAEKYASWRPLWGRLRRSRPLDEPSYRFISLTHNFTWSHHEVTLQCDECGLGVDAAHYEMFHCDEYDRFEYCNYSMDISWNRKIADILVQQHFIHKYTADELLESVGMAPVLK